MPHRVIRSGGGKWHGVSERRDVTYCGLDFYEKKNAERGWIKSKRDVAPGSICARCFDL